METRTDLTAFAAKIGEVRKRIADVVVGQTEAVDMLLTCIIADGHVLLEGVPGVAKTLLARLMSRLIDARFSRIQFTPDLMPSDVLGTSVFNMKTQEFSFHPGPAFCRHNPRRRDKPCTGQDAGCALRGDGGTTGHHRRHVIQDGRRIHHHRHPEPDRAGRHLPSA